MQLEKDGRLPSNLLREKSAPSKAAFFPTALHMSGKGPVKLLDRNDIPDRFWGSGGRLPLNRFDPIDIRSITEFSANAPRVPDIELLLRSRTDRARFDVKLGREPERMLFETDMLLSSGRDEKLCNVPVRRLEKRAILTEKSLSDTKTNKKAAYYSETSPLVVDASNKHLLKNPLPIKDLNSK